MIGQLFGALLRAAIVVLVMATPSLLLPGLSAEDAQLVTLVALALGIFVAFEYSSPYPALTEFRDAPPFNRVRILTLFLTLFFLSLVAPGSQSDSSLVLVLRALGVLVGQALDFPWSPLHVLLDNLPPGTSPNDALLVQIMAGLAVFIMLFALCVFATLLRLQHWPSRGSAFNVWVNLPTFDPTKGGDVVTKLNRDGRVNIILGFVLPFVIPIVTNLAAGQIDLQVVGSSHALVWGIALWTFLPLSLFMRGMAMRRIAEMIALKRAQLTAGLEADAPGAAQAPRLPAQVSRSA